MIFVEFKSSINQLIIGVYLGHVIGPSSFS